MVVVIVSRGAATVRVPVTTVDTTALGVTVATATSVIVEVDAI